MTEIYVWIEGTAPQLHGWVAGMRRGLGDQGRVRHQLPERDDDETHFETVWIDVLEASTESEALDCIQPIVRELDWDLLRGGTTTMQLVIPAPNVP